MRKLLFILPILFIVACHKSSNNSPSFIYSQALDSIGLSSGKSCLVGSVVSPSSDTVTFYSDGWVNERANGENISYKLSFNSYFDVIVTGGSSKYLHLNFFVLLDTFNIHTSALYSRYSNCKFLYNISDTAKYVSTLYTKTTSDIQLRSNSISNYFKLYYLP